MTETVEPKENAGTPSGRLYQKLEEARIEYEQSAYRLELDRALAMQLLLKDYQEKCAFIIKEAKALLSEMEEGA